MLSDYNITNQSTVHMVLRLCGGGFLGYCIDSSLFHHQYNFDFTNIRVGNLLIFFNRCNLLFIQDDGKVFYRGGKIYTRPIGSKRYAIKVLDQYEDNKWLGSQGNRESGEWPVAYHGTEESNVLDIVKQGFDLEKCRRFAYVLVAVFLYYQLFWVSDMAKEFTAPLIQ